MDFLFDIGRVLLDFDFQPSLRRLLGEESAQSEAQLAAILSKSKFFESGKLSTEEFLSWAMQHLSASISQEQFIHAWRDIFTPNEAMWEVARQLHADSHRLILFSNTNALHCPHIFERWPEFERLFAGKILSHKVGSMKPSAGMYQFALKEFQLVPEKTLYIDDLAANIETGKRFGFQCWRYDLKQHEDFLTWLSSQVTSSS